MSCTATAKILSKPERQSQNTVKKTIQKTANAISVKQTAANTFL